MFREQQWVSFFLFPLLSHPGSNCSDSAASSSVSAIYSCPFHLRSLNDLKKKKNEGGRNKVGE